MINQIWILIGKKLSGEASPEELLELEELLNQGGEDQYPIGILEEIWKSEHQTRTIEDLENKWKSFEEELDVADAGEIVEAEPLTETAPEAPQKSGILKFIKITLLIAAACFACVFFLVKRNNVVEDIKNNEIIAPQSGISQIQLPDGTKVWLNADSKLVYGANYGNEYRKVSLTGEALFDVVKDAKHPFIVTTKSISIRVLGTKFNVRSYNNDKTSEAALIRGQIELTVLKNPEKKIILNASDKLTVVNDEQQPEKNALSNNLGSGTTEETPIIALSRIHQAKRDTLPSEALWIENKLAFDAEDFEDLADKLDRRYNVTITFKNEEVKRMRFTGRFKNESIGRALKALQTTNYFHYKTNNNQILIY